MSVHPPTSIVVDNFEVDLNCNCTLGTTCIPNHDVVVLVPRYSVEESRCLAREGSCKIF